MSESTSGSTAIVRLPVNMLRALTPEQMEARHPRATNASLNLDVRRIHVALWSDETYRRCVTSTASDKTSWVHGSQGVDRVMASVQIRDFAEMKGVVSVSTANVTDIKRALGNTLRFYELLPAAA